jgi:hypothetical protein
MEKWEAQRITVMQTSVDTRKRKKRLIGVGGKTWQPTWYKCITSFSGNLAASIVAWEVTTG